jgi:hypothetical protein
VPRAPAVGPAARAPPAKRDRRRRSGARSAAGRDGSGRCHRDTERHRAAWRPGWPLPDPTPRPRWGQNRRAAGRARRLAPGTERRAAIRSCTSLPRPRFRSCGFRWRRRAEPRAPARAGAVTRSLAVGQEGAPGALAGHRGGRQVAQRGVQGQRVPGLLQVAAVRPARCPGRDRGHDLGERAVGAGLVPHRGGDRLHQLELAVVDGAVAGAQGRPGAAPTRPAPPRAAGRRCGRAGHDAARSSRSGPCLLACSGRVLWVWRMRRSRRRSWRLARLDDGAGKCSTEEENMPK